MLLNDKTLEAIVRGEISVVFRVWKRPTVKTGGTLTTRKGVMSIDKVERVDPSKVTAADIKNAGLASRDELRGIEREGDFYKITLHYHGEDPRIALRGDTDEKKLKAVCEKLGGMGDWTVWYLRMVRDQPNVHAQILADSVGLGKATFKGRVRRLKALGLTESLRPGYRLSVRGKKVLELLAKKTTK